MADEPMAWLRFGRDHDYRIAGQTTPILDQLRRELDLAAPQPAGKPKLEGLTPAHAGEFATAALLISKVRMLK